MNLIYRRTSQSIEETLELLFLYTKIGTCADLYLHKAYLLLGIYIVLFLATFLGLPQPSYQGPTRVQSLTHETFFRDILHRPLPDASAKIVELDSSADADTVKHVVLFTATWSAASRNVEVVLHRLSLDYSSDETRFYAIDVDSVPDAAIECNVDTGPTSLTLPSVIAFEKGEEIARLPCADAVPSAPSNINDGKGTETGNKARKAISQLSWDRSAKSIIDTFKLEKGMSNGKEKQA